jgi:hypothetical protein
MYGRTVPSADLKLSKDDLATLHKAFPLSSNRRPLEML